MLKVGCFPWFLVLGRFVGVHVRACVRVREPVSLACSPARVTSTGFEHYQIVHAYFIVADTFLSTAAVFFGLSLSSSSM